MLTGLQLSEKVLSENRVPMSCDQIWAYAVQMGYDQECGVSGKTPSRTLQSQLYVNIRDRSDSHFVQVSSRPPLFGLKGMTYDEMVSDSGDGEPRFRERDLHPLLVSYLDSDPHFRGHTRTIFHESSSKSKRNSEKWMHPDLVSVHYPFDELDPITLELAGNSGLSGVDLFSFELKVSITGSNVREYFFQAVSNSSWANEGYLVAASINEAAMQQLGRLCPSFGIGLILLDVKDVHQSEILIPAELKEAVDLGIIDDLLKINDGFKEFIQSVNDSIKTRRVIGDYDIVMDDDRLSKYILEKKISFR